VIEDCRRHRGLNPRVAISEYNEEAVRFAASTGSRRCRLDAHVPQGLGSVRIRMRDSTARRSSGLAARGGHHPPAASLLLVQALKFCRRRATPAPARRAARSAGAAAREEAVTEAATCGARRGERPAPPSNPPVDAGTDDEIRAKYLERAIRELNSLTARSRTASTARPRPISCRSRLGHPQADIFLVKHSARHAEVERASRFYGPLGDGADDSR